MCDEPPLEATERSVSNGDLPRDEEVVAVGLEAHRRGHSSSHGIDPPSSGDAFQFVLPSVVELESRSNN
jgi:hypothetical protein